MREDIQNRFIDKPFQQNVINSKAYDDKFLKDVRFTISTRPFKAN